MTPTPSASARVHDVLVHSSNIGAAKLALQLGETRLYNYIKLLGFGERTGIDLPGEINGRVAPTRNWTKISITRIPMGQGVCVTPLQMVMAMGAVANGGKLMMPHIVHSITDDKDVPVAEFPPVIVRQAISPETVQGIGPRAGRRGQSARHGQGRGGARLRRGRQDRHGAKGLARRRVHDGQIRGVVRRVFADQQSRTRRHGDARQRQHQAERKLRRAGGRARLRVHRGAGDALSEHRADDADPADRRQLEGRRGAEQPRLTSRSARPCNSKPCSPESRRATVRGRDDVEITSICYDSRQAKPGALFVAMRGEHVDGHDYVAQAVARGAAGVVVDHEAGPVPDDVTYIEVTSTQTAMPALAGAFYHQPSLKLRLCGVTGTNGKTTTTYLLKHICERAMLRCGLIGTVRYEIGDEVLPSTHTTPQSLDLQALLAQMRDARLQGGGDGSFLARPRAGSRGRGGVRRGGVYEPHAGPPRLPSEHPGVFRRKGPAVHGNPSPADQEEAPWRW